jgi:hypothetical protein
MTLLRHQSSPPCGEDATVKAATSRRSRRSRGFRGGWYQGQRRSAADRLLLLCQADPRPPRRPCACSTTMTSRSRRSSRTTRNTASGGAAGVLHRSAESGRGTGVAGADCEFRRLTRRLRIPESKDLRHCMPSERSRICGMKQMSAVPLSILAADSPLTAPNRSFMVAEPTCCCEAQTPRVRILSRPPIRGPS